MFCSRRNGRSPLRLSPLSDLASVDPTEDLPAFVRQTDPDRYLSILYAPQDKREALLTLLAFNVEIASVRERVSQPIPGEMRLQWWRDVLTAGTAEAAGGSPLAVKLVETVRTHPLPIEPFLNMLDARVFDLYDDPMPARNDLEGYCGETASALIQLQALVLDPKAAVGTGEMAGYAGCAQAIAGLLRSLPIHRARGQCYVPQDILRSAGMTPESLIAGEDRAGIARVVSAMVALGRDHLTKFEARAKGLPARVRAAFLPVSLTKAYLDRIEAKADRVADEIVDISPIRKQWAVFRRASRGW